MITTRRKFLRSTVLGGSIGWTVPSFLSRTFDQLHADERDKAIAAITGKDAPILVVVQLAGGNDGLNTVVPFDDDNYRRARPRLGLKTDSVLRLTDQIGLHPALRGFRDLYDAGQLSIIQAVGYPNPNRSHFRSTEIWQTASDSNRFEKEGWIGRYFDNACAGADPVVGLSIGRQLPQAFAARRPLGIALENPAAYRFAEGRDEGMMGTEKSYRTLTETDDFNDSSSESGGTIATLPGATTESLESPIDFLERTALDAQMSSDLIRNIAGRVTNYGGYPGGQLAQGLKLIARLIGGGLGTRIYYVGQGGYDTHTNQLGAHERLLRDLGDSVSAFVTDLKSQGNLDRVVVMTFSEFGRRVSENASLGTDHGAAAPVFVCGSRIRAGIVGESPSLAPTDLLNGDVRFRVDFRSVYAGLLENWLRTPSVPILKRLFRPVPIIA